MHAMIARSKRAVRAGGRTDQVSPGRNARNSVRVHVSYRAFSRARAFRPFYRAFNAEHDGSAEPATIEGEAGDLALDEDAA